VTDRAALARRLAGVMFPATIRVIDSHTEGEPTRVVLDGWPQPLGDTMRPAASPYAATPTICAAP
jgi:proline racemase